MGPQSQERGADIALTAPEGIAYFFFSRGA